MKGNTETLLSILAYSFCSGTLVLLNKVILVYFPYPSVTVSIQLVATLVFVYAAKHCCGLAVDELRWKYAVPYLWYIAAFAAGIYCNMRSLQISNVETVIIFRALSPCLVAVWDALFLGRTWPTPRSWSGLGLIVVGAYGYALTDTRFQQQGWHAYAWPLLYLFVISFEMAYGKRILTSVDLKTLSGPVLYTNLLGLPAMLAFAYMGNEFTRIRQDVEEGHFIPTFAFLVFALACIVGTAIGYSAWWCRDRVSATSFTLIGVLNKCLTVLLNLLIWDNHAGPGGIACLLLCLVGGAVYQQAPMRKDVKMRKSAVVTDAGLESVASRTDESEELMSKDVLSRRMESSLSDEV
jgi:GDP-mannose transporter